MASLCDKCKEKCKQLDFVILVSCKGFNDGSEKPTKTKKPRKPRAEKPRLEDPKDKTPKTKQVSRKKTSSKKTK